jgi:hypothetical protein
MPTYREVVAEWLTIEVFDGAFPAAQWRRAHQDALAEAAITNGATTWEWHSTAWGAVLELLFESDERLEQYRWLPTVRAALDAVPDRVSGLLIYRGPGGGAGAGLPRHPRRSPLAGAAALPDPAPEYLLEMTSTPDAVPSASAG